MGGSFYTWDWAEQQRARMKAGEAVPASDMRMMIEVYRMIAEHRGERLEDMRYVIEEAARSTANAPEPELKLKDGRLLLVSGIHRDEMEMT